MRSHVARNDQHLTQRHAQVGVTNDVSDPDRDPYEIMLQRNLLSIGIPVDEVGTAIANLRVQGQVRMAAYVTGGLRAALEDYLEEERRKASEPWGD